MMKRYIKLYKKEFTRSLAPTQHSLNRIWEAYLTNDPNNQIVQKDKPNVIALAKRFAVLNHFKNLKN